MPTGTLYVVGTPIGNLNDLSPRANEILRSVDEILCEDTRVTAKLLQKLEIKAAVSSIHQHSTDAELERVVQKLKDGANLAYVSDAGTPNISDPGGRLVQFAAEHGVDIVPIPGASAVATALSVCGFPADTFAFLGFPPHKKGRKSFFELMNKIDRTIVIYESKHRILKTLSELPQDRKMFVGRELTKMHETMYRGTAPEVMKMLESGSAKGEFVIVLAPTNWK